MRAPSNSIATVFSYDIYRRWRPEASDRTLVIVGRVVTFSPLVGAIIWSPFISRYPSIYQGIVALISCIALADHRGISLRRVLEKGQFQGGFHHVVGGFAGGMGRCSLWNGSSRPIGCGSMSSGTFP